MDYSIKLSANSRELSVAPGAAVELGVTVQNLTTLLDQVALRVEGVDPTWIRVIPPDLPVFAQNQATARVIIQPPGGRGQPDAGIYPLVIKGRSQEMLGEVNEVGVNLEIQFNGDYNMRLEPAPITHTGEILDRVLVENQSNAPLDLHFQGSDPVNALWYKFEPFHVLVQPGATGISHLALRPRPDAPSGPRSFQITAEGTYQLRDGSALTAPRRQVSGDFGGVTASPLAVTLLPQHAAGSLGTLYEVRLANPNPAPVTAQIVAHSHGGELFFELGSAQVTLPAQGTTSVSLTARPASAPLPGALFWALFEVQASPVDGFTPPGSAQATLVQRMPDVALDLPILPAATPPLTVILSGILSFLVTFMLLASAAYAIGYYH